MFKKVHGGQLKRPMYVRASVKAQPKPTKSIKAYVRKAVNDAGELKYFDTGAVTATCDTTGYIAYLNSVIIGTNVNNRLGVKIRMKNVEIRGMIQNSTTAQTNKVAVMLVYSKDAAGVSGTTGVITTVSPNAMDNMDRVGTDYIVLRRWEFILNGSPSAATSNSSVNFHKIVPLNKITQYERTDTTGALYATGRLQLVFAGDHGAGTTSANCYFQSRVNFWDA